MNLITITGYDNGNYTTGKVYVLRELPNIPKSKLYTVFEKSEELFKVADRENSNVKILSKHWVSGGSRRYPIMYCLSVYSLPETIILGWAFLQWGYFHGRQFPKVKIEGVAVASNIPKIPLEQRVAFDYYGIISNREEFKVLKWKEEIVDELFEGMQSAITPTAPVETSVSSEDVRLKSVLEKL